MSQVSATSSPDSTFTFFCFGPVRVGSAEEFNHAKVIYLNVWKLKYIALQRQVLDQMLHGTQLHMKLNCTELTAEFSVVRLYKR